MAAELTTDETRKLRALWLQWQVNRPPHQALYFDFHEEVVTTSEELNHLSLFQTLGALVPLQSTTQDPVD